MIGVGARIGSYEVVAELGRGGMATLFLGRSGARSVAIKVIHPEIASDPEVVRMFFDEARLGVAIRHPNVVTAEAFAEHEGSPYLVMEYVEGATLTQVLRGQLQRRAWLPIETVVAIALRVAEALHAAHESTDELGRPLGIIHRDVSPSNILVDTRGQVKLIDFGVAKARHRLARTTPGAVKGKLAYMAPEQLAAGEIDRRVDVFALGVVIWEMLTLRRLFHAPSDIETMLRIRSAEPIAPPSHHRADIPPPLDDVVQTMLARDLNERFCTAAAARHALFVTCPAAAHVHAAALAELASSCADAQDEPTVPDRPKSR